MVSISTWKGGVVIARGDKTVTLSYGDIIDVVYRESDEVLLDNGVRMDVLNTGSSDMEYCIKRCYNGCVKSSFHLSRSEWNQVVTFACNMMKTQH